MSLTTATACLTAAIQDNAIAKNMTEGKTGVTMCTFEDGDKFVAYAPLNSTSWSVAVVMPLNEVIAPALSH